MNLDPLSKDALILAVETAVAGGSLALVRDDRIIASCYGAEPVLRAEGLLATIADLLDSQQIDRCLLDLIAVSNGPGSYTGIRIGIATALGLGKALNIECVGVPLLSAMATKYRKQSDCIVAVPIGRNELCWQPFEQTIGLVDSPMTGSADQLILYIIELGHTEILLHHDAYIAIAARAGFDRLQPRTHDCGRDLAVAVAFASRDSVSDTKPNYVRNSQSLSNPF